MPGTSAGVANRAAVAYRIEAPAGLRDRVVGELHSLGTLGVVERDDALIAYFALPLGSEAQRALLGCGARVGGAEPVPDADWSRAWRRGLAPRRIGPLWIRPSWCAPRANAVHNRLPLGVARATLAAVAPAARFDVAVANLLWARLEPELPRLAEHCGRALVVAGYLDADVERLRARAVACGWVVETERRETQSGDCWCSARLAHRRARQSSSSSRSVSSIR